jgi:2C-methyl-D-erythritol 2,4-cyclodiphosphate synthase
MAMSDKELKQLIEINAKTAQAMLDEIADARQERQELREGMIQLQNAVVRLTNLQEGIANLLVSVDGDRPTILKKLTAIENKLNQLLQQPEDQLE